MKIIELTSKNIFARGGCSERCWGSPLLGAALAGLLLLSGCATPPRYDTSRDLFAQGRYQEAVDTFKDLERSTPEADADNFILDDLLIGSSELAQHHFAAARAAFDRSEEGFRVQDAASAAGTATSKTLATLTGENALPYEAQQYDRIMANTYKAITHLAEGDVDSARVEFARAEERQRLSSVYFGRLIAKEKAEQQQSLAGGQDASEQNAAGLVGQAMSSPDAQAALAAYDQANSQWPSYENFLVPYSTVFRAVFLTLFGEDRSDFDEAVRLLERCEAAIPAALSLQTARKLAEARAETRLNATGLDRVVWVLYEGGLGPRKIEYRFDLIVPSSPPFTVTIALPSLQEGTPAYPSLLLCDGPTAIGQTEVICDMNAVVANEFRTRRTGIITRSVIGTALKSTLSFIAAASLQHNDHTIAGDLVGFGLGVLMIATTHADTRIWNQLPANAQLGICKRPDSGRLTLRSPDGTLTLAHIDLPEDTSTLLYVREPIAGAPLSVVVIPADVADRVRAGKSAELAQRVRPGELPPVEYVPPSNDPIVFGNGNDFDDDDD